MGLFTVYIVKQRLTGIIDSVWKAQYDANARAENLNARKSEIDKQFNITWLVEKEEVQ